MTDPDPTVAAIQTAVDNLRVERNVDRLRDRIVNLPDRVDIAVCPEYALTGFADDDRLRNVALGRSAAVDRLSEIAATGEVDVVAGYVERDGDEQSAETGPRTGNRVGGELYNATAYVPTPDVSGREAAVYRKRHLWGAERERLTPGSERVVVETPAGPAGVLTCYDLNFVAESAWYTERAVDALFVPGAWPAAHAANWRLLLRARALDGVRWVVGAGRVGRLGGDEAAGDAGGREDGSGDADGVEYAGCSLVARPDGRIGAALGHEKRDLIVTLDRSVLERQRELVGSVPERGSV